MMCNVQVLRFKVYGNAPASLQLEDPLLASRYLTNIELRGLVFNNDFLDFSRCPTLQNLKIKDCSFIDVERISSQSLKHLDIRRGIFNLSSRTGIHTPNLDSLRLEIYGGRTPILEKMPLLVVGVIAIFSNSDCCSHSNNGNCGDWSCKGCIQNETSSVLLHAISQAKELELGAFPEMEGYKVNGKMNGRFNPTELPSTMSPHLKRVKVRCGAVDKGVFKVLQFLSKLNIGFSFKEKKCKAEDESSAT